MTDDASQPSRDRESPLIQLAQEPLSPSSVGHPDHAGPIVPLGDILQRLAPSQEQPSRPQPHPGYVGHCQAL